MRHAYLVVMFWLSMVGPVPPEREQDEHRHAPVVCDLLARWKGVMRDRHPDDDRSLPDFARRCGTADN